MRAYFDYNPVGTSLFALDPNGNNEGMPITKLNFEKPQAIIEAVAAFISTNDVHQLFCNKAALGIGVNIRQYLSSKYNYTSCEILENK